MNALPIREDAIALRAVLAQAGIQAKQLADACGVSKGTISMLLTRGIWPVRADALRAGIETFLRGRGIEPAPALFKKEPPRSNAAAPAPTAESQDDQQKENDMLLRKTPLTRAAREHFGLNGDPFREVSEADDVLLTADFRYIRDAMLDKIKFGGFLGVVGESGSGKSTLRESLIDQLHRTMPNVIVVQPYMLASESADRHGKTLKALHIAEAVMASVAPTAKIMSSPEARFRQLHATLVESSRNGMKHVLIIEEAHSLPIPTLKHLKRFLELKDGLKPLMSVILVGQPELADKLAEGTSEVREVVQRIELAHLLPLDGETENYLAHRFKFCGVPLARVFDQSGLDALREHLGSERRGSLSRTYPLAVHNLAARAMNAAAALGAPRVTADFFKVM